MQTRQELIAATLTLLNAIGSGQTPEAEDVETIDKIINGKLSELNRREIMWFDDTTKFEDEYMDPLAIILADAAAPSFGQPRNPDSRMDAETRLRQMRPTDRVDVDVTPSEYF